MQICFLSEFGNDLLMVNIVCGSMNFIILMYLHLLPAIKKQSWTKIG